MQIINKLVVHVLSEQQSNFVAKLLYLISSYYRHLVQIQHVRLLFVIIGFLNNISQIFSRIALQRLKFPNQGRCVVENLIACYEGMCVWRLTKISDERERMLNFDEVTVLSSRIRGVWDAFASLSEVYHQEAPTARMIAYQSACLDTLNGMPPSFRDVVAFTQLCRSLQTILDSGLIVAGVEQASTTPCGITASSPLSQKGSTLAI
jgi:hypothetical protein